TPDESKASYEVFESYIRFMKRFPDVRFVTASEAATLYRDRARGRTFRAADLKAVARNVGDAVGFQTFDDHALSAAEVFLLLNTFVAGHAGAAKVEGIELTQSPLGPTGT